VLFVSRLLRPLAGAFVVLALLAIAGPVSAGGRTLRFTVQTGTGCIDGQGIPQATHVLSLRSAKGVLRSRARVRADRRGDFYGCLPGGSGRAIRAGDTVHVRSDGIHRQVTIPNLQSKVDWLGDTVSGRAPAGSRLHLGAFTPGPHRLVTFLVGSSGQWSYDFSPYLDLASNTAIGVGVERAGITVETWIQTP
jgi:hypothetical protein